MIMNLSAIVAGIDVSKAKLDVYIHPLGEYRTFDNKEGCVAKWVWLY